MVDAAKDGSSASEKIFLKEPRGSSAQVQLFGGQVTSWKNDRGEELLFLSSKAVFKPPKAIRGGIPICFPQFGSFGGLEQHGFARNRIWAVETVPGTSLVSGNNTRTSVDLLLKPNEDDLKIWQHNFELRLRVSLGSAEISEVRIEGLETLDYLDSLQDKQRHTDQGDALTFDAEVDRIYLDTPSKIAVIDHERKRTFVVRKDGLPDAVVWNPWEKKAKALTDFGDEEYKHMLCVEAAAIEKPINLKPGEEWTGRQELSAVPSSYFSGQLEPHRVVQGS